MNEMDRWKWSDQTVNQGIFYSEVGLFLGVVVKERLLAYPKGWQRFGSLGKEKILSKVWLTNILFQLIC